jgi:hypothetical protein
MNQDADSDGKLSREEAPERLVRQFDAADSNSDGQLDEVELRQIARRIAQRMENSAGPDGPGGPQGPDGARRPRRPRGEGGPGRPERPGRPHRPERPDRPASPEQPAEAETDDDASGDSSSA